MKLRVLSIFLLLLSIIVVISCKKDDNDNNNKTTINVWAVGDKDSGENATIFHSSDGGESWEQQGYGQDALKNINLNDVWAVSDDIVWAVGFPGAVIKTTDGGLNWQTIATADSLSEKEFVSIAMYDNQIWISGSGGTIIITDDEGATWQAVDSEVLGNNYLQGIHALNANKVFVVGGPMTSSRGFCAVSDDGGITWNEYVPEDDYNRNRWIGCRSAGSETVVIFGAESHYMLSTDSGNTWKNDSISGTGGTNGADINCLTMLDTQTWWGAFDYDHIGITTDGGDTWGKQESAGPGAEWLFGIDYYNIDICVIVGQASSSSIGKILNTTDGGENWKLAVETTTHMNKVSFVKP